MWEARWRRPGQLDAPEGLFNGLLPSAPRLPRWPVTQAWVLGFDMDPHSLDDSVGVHTHDMITAFPEDTVAVIVAEGRIPLAAAGALESYWCKIPSSR